MLILFHIRDPVFCFLKGSGWFYSFNLFSIIKGCVRKDVFKGPSPIMQRQTMSENFKSKADIVSVQAWDPGIVYNWVSFIRDRETQGKYNRNVPLYISKSVESEYCCITYNIHRLKILITLYFNLMLGKLYSGVWKGITFWMWLS